MSRQRVLIILLILSNFGIGVASYYFLKAVDQEYSDLIDNNFSVLNRMRALAWEITLMQRHAANAQRAGGLDATAAAQMEATRVKGQVLFNAIEASPGTRAFPKAAQALIAVNTDYAQALQEWRSLIDAHRIAEAETFRLEKMRPLLDRYMNALADVANHVEQQGNDLSDRYSDKAHFFGNVVLLLASWPLWLGVGLLVLAVGLLLSVLIPHLRHYRESEP